MRYELYNPQQAHTVFLTLWPKVKEAMQGGNKLVLEIKKKTKSRDTEKKYHAMINEIARQAQHQGATWSSEDWKRLLCDQFVRDMKMEGAQIVQTLDGQGIVQLGIQTRQFTQEQANQFIEWLHQWGANNGVEFSQ